MDGGWASPPGGPSRGELEQGFLWFDAPALESTSMDFSQLLVGMQASPARDSGGPHGDGGGGGGALASPGPLLAALLPNAPLGMPQLPQPAMMMPPMPLPPMPLPQQPVLVPVTQLHAQSSVPAAQHAAAQQAAAAFQQQQAQQAAAAFQQQQGQQAAAAFQQQQAQQAAAAFQQQQAQQGAAAFQQQQGQQAAAAFQQQQAQQEAAQASAQRAAAAFQQQQAQQEQQEAGGAAGGGRGGGGRGGRGGRRRVSEEERRARNRATQARFRERQKVKNDAMAATYAAAESELQRLRGEHAGLESHQAALQKMLFTKDVALGVLGGPLPAAPSRGVGDTTMVQVKAEQQEQQEEEQQQQQQQQASLSVASPRGAAHLSSAHSASTGSAASASASASAGGSATMAGGGDGGGDGLQRRSSSGAGLSRAVARQMEQLGNDLTAHFAQLELPLDAHPDEAMAVGQATLVPSSAAGTAAALPEQAFEGEYEDDEEEWEEEEEGEAEETAAEPAGRAAGSGGGGSTTSSPLVSVRTRSARSGGQARGGEEQRLVQLARARPELLQRILSMSAEEFVADWRQKAAMFRDILHMQGAAPRSPTTQDELDRILSIFKEWSGTFSLTLRHKPENATALFATAATAPAELWRSVAARLEPSRAQRTMLQQLWHSYAGRVQALRAERAAAMEVVQHAAQHAATVTPASLPATTLNGLMSQYLALFDAAGRLSTLRDAEFVAMLQLMGRTGAVFSPLQKARLVAAAHPYFPGDRRSGAREQVSAGSAVTASETISAAAGSLLLRCSVLHRIYSPGHHGGVDADGTVRVWQDGDGVGREGAGQEQHLVRHLPPLLLCHMSLLLSLRVGRNYDRWWTARCGFAGVGSAASTLVGQATSWIDSPQLQIVRADTEPHPTSAALLHEDELALYRQSRKPRQLASSQLRLLVCEGRQHGLSEEQAIAMDAAIVKEIGDASACVRVRFQAMPHSLTLVSTGFLQIWLLLLRLGLWEGTAWFGLVAMFFTALLLLCVDEVATQLENPFPLLPLEEILDSTVRDTGREAGRRAGGGGGCRSVCGGQAGRAGRGADGGLLLPLLPLLQPPLLLLLLLLLLLF